MGGTVQRKAGECDDARYGLPSTVACVGVSSRSINVSGIIVELVPMKLNLNLICHEDIWCRH
jgi:hypothetical protein